MKLILALLACVAIVGCGDDDDDSAGVVDPGPTPSPTTGPDPDPEPDPGPGPAPDPDPHPQPDPAPGWVQQDSGTQLTFTAVSAVDANRAWAAAGSQVFRTTNGGTTWTLISQTPPISSLGGDRPPIVHMQFHDQNNGWALTFYSALRTSDGGDTWQEKFPTLVFHWSGFSSISATTAWMTSEKSADVVRTQDGGGNWDFQDAGGGLGRALKFVDGSTGWLAVRNGSIGDGETVFKTTNGGATWQQSLFMAGDFDSLWIRDLTTAGSSHVWVVAGTSTGGPGGERIMASSNGGATWTEQQSDGSGGLRDVHFMNATTGWIAGLKIHHTTNGGATWFVQDTPTEGFRDLVFVSLTVGWAVGENGVILKTTTGGN
jgi:photosystem II stability/assembly factor-like uncharacterized protein